MGKAISGSIRWLLRLFGLVGVLIAVYLLAALGGSLIPANADREPPENGITIYLHDNGIHTGFILPRTNAIADWSDLVRPEHLPDPALASDHLLFGWGDRAFYLETPSWADLKPDIALLALIGSEASLLHVDHVGPPRPDKDTRALTVTPDEYRAIAEAIRADFALSDGGEPQPVRGYGSRDIFYEAEGRYTAFRTCNEWTGSILRDAGVRVGVWTPFSASVMRWF
ncbi:MAG: TIGR02117 family protein [Parasphingopyxis sp.]